MSGFPNLENRTSGALALVAMCWAFGSAAPALAQEDSWTARAPMPTAREKLAACAIDGRVYALGGAVGENQPGLAENERYDPASNSWSVRAPMPTGRRSLTAAAVAGTCYAIGGRANLASTIYNEVEAYDPGTNSWSTRAAMPTPRFGAAAAVLDGIIYVVGGVTTGTNILTTLEAYDPADDSWESLAPMTTQRAFPGAAAVDGKIYVMGGTTNPGSQQWASMEVYDPVSDSWSAAANMPTGRAAPSAAVVNGRLYAIGGGVETMAVGNVEEYDPAVDAWTARTPMPTARVRFAAAIVSGRIYTVGGAQSVVPPHPGRSTVEAYTPPLAEGSGFTINSGLTDAWYDPDTAGQGFFFVVFPEIERVFASWFTFETDVRPAPFGEAVLGEPYHRWLTALGGWEGNRATLDVVLTTGGVFDDPTPVQNSGPDEYGTLVVEFQDCENAKARYDLAALNLQGEIPLVRIVDDRVALCEALSDEQN